MRFAPLALVAFIVLMAQAGGAAASPGELSPAQRLQQYRAQNPSDAIRPNMPARPALPGAAPNIPMPPASVMATTQGNPAPAGAQASATAPQLAPADESVLKKDSLTVEQLEGKMVASSDAYWQHQNRLHEFDLLRRYQAAQQVLEQTQASAAASTAGAE